MLFLSVEAEKIPCFFLGGGCSFSLRKADVSGRKIGGKKLLFPLAICVELMS